MLLKLNDEDFINLDVKSVIHKKKILVEMERICPLRNRGEMEDLDNLYLKRERIRNLQKRSYAVRMIQNLYRRYRGKVMILNLKLMVKLNHKKILMDAMIQNSRGWWTDKKIPAKNIKPYTGVILNEKEEIKRNNEEVLMEKKMMKRNAINALEVEKYKSNFENQLLVMHKKDSVRSFLSVQKSQSNQILKKNEKNESEIKNRDKNEKKNENENENYSDTESIISFSNQNYLIDSDPFISSPNANTNTNTIINVFPMNREYTNSQFSHTNNQAKNVLFYIGTDMHVNKSKYKVTKLPEIKTFGRKCDHIRGINRVKYDKFGKWIPSIDDRLNVENSKLRLIDSQNSNEKLYRIDNRNLIDTGIDMNMSKGNININGNINISSTAYICSDDISQSATLSITQQLRTSGYDERRLEIFMNNRHN